MLVFVEYLRDRNVCRVLDTSAGFITCMTVEEMQSSGVIGHTARLDCFDMELERCDLTVSELVLLSKVWTGISDEKLFELLKVNLHIIDLSLLLNIRPEFISVSECWYEIIQKRFIGKQTRKYFQFAVFLSELLIVN